MATSTYLNGRKKYGRPQGMLWSENPGSLDSQTGLWIPSGYSTLDSVPGNTAASERNQFLILSDDNRAPIDFSFERIETRQRMINGRMRSHHIADKLAISTAWDLLPSRSFSADPQFDSSGIPVTGITSYTTDGGAGGAEILEWYENHPGSFYVYLAYDKYTNFSSDKYSKLAQYNEVVEVFFSDFSYTVEKRGRSNFDFWNISLTLEEV